MLLKKEKYRQILFLILIIGCTVMVYTNWYLKKEKRDEITSGSAVEKHDNGLLKNEPSPQIHFNSFIKNPNSKEGVNSLFNAVVKWELLGLKDSVQYALKEFDAVVKSESLKNSFYNRLGQFYISSYREISLSTAMIKKNNEIINPVGIVLQKGVCSSL